MENFCKIRQGLPWFSQISLVLTLPQTVFGELIDAGARQSGAKGKVHFVKGAVFPHFLLVKFT